MKFDDIVFEGRNKGYGAYVLRKGHTKNLALALFITLFVFGSVLAVPFLMPKKQAVKKPEVKITEVTLTEIKTEEKKIELPQIKQQPQQKMESVKFTVPLVTDEPEDITTVEDLELVNPGLITQEGDSGVFAQLPTGDDDDQVIGNTDVDDVFTFVEAYPEYPGGIDALHKFLEENLIYPYVAKEQTIQGTVHLMFVVDKEGHIKNIEVVRGIGGGCDEEAVRVIQMMPNWHPGKNNGRTVSVKIHLPIRFVLG